MILSPRRRFFTPLLMLSALAAAAFVTLMLLIAHYGYQLRYSALLCYAMLPFHNIYATCT